MKCPEFATVPSTNEVETCTSSISEISVQPNETLVKVIYKSILVKNRAEKLLSCFLWDIGFIAK